MAYTLTRDSFVWWVGMVGGVAMAILLYADQLPILVTPVVREGLILTAVVAAVVSGKLATSPLPGKRDVAAGEVVADATRFRLS